jgi:1-acyl-sn-glycerol-3-phosphate acyltransferase
MTDPFKDIRPYNDDEIRPVLDSLLADDEFIRSIAGFSHPRLFKILPVLVCALARRKLTAELKNVSNVKSMQDVIATYMDKMIERTTTSLTHSGLEGLSKDKSYLFISNHRDIAMDPAFVNYMLYHADFETLRIAIGDNLLKREFVSDLMRLNKSFIVKRSLKGRELLKSSKQLSEYIHHCVETHCSVWIAQREGRAKDGIDKTETALLKMLALAKRPNPIAEALQSLHIIPVSISYEIDACDSLKGNELYQKIELGSYQKDEKSDIHSIVTGMIGYKGHVHVAFGKELELTPDDDDDHIARLIDEQIIGNYHLHGTNILAVELLRKMDETLVPQVSDEGARILARSQINPVSKTQFEDRISKLDSNIKRYVLQMYANPFFSRYALMPDMQGTD